MSSNKKFVNLLNKNEMDKRIAQLAQAEALSDARQEGQTLAPLAAVQKVLSKRLKISTESYAPQLATLSATKLAALHEAALDFQSASDLEHWLEKNYCARLYCSSFADFCDELESLEHSTIQ